MTEERIARERHQRRVAEQLPDMTLEELGEAYCLYADSYTITLMNGFMEEVFRRGISLTDLEDFCS